MTTGANRPPILAWQPIPEKPDEVICDAGFGKKLLRRWRKNPYDGKVLDHQMIAQKPWATVLAVTKDGLVPAVREYKQGRDTIGLELPAGTPSYGGKTMEQVMTDQLLTETGYQAGKVVYLGLTWMASRNSPTAIHHFLALDCVKSREGAWDAREAIETVIMTLLEWISLTHNTKDVEDHSAIVASHRAEKYLVEAGLINECELRIARSGGGNASAYTGTLKCTDPRMDDARRKIREVNSSESDFATTAFDVYEPIPLGNHVHWRKTETFSILPADWQPHERAGYGFVVLQRVDRKLNALEQPQRVDLQPGMVVHIPPGCAHTFVLTPDTRMICHNGSCFHSSDMPTVPLVDPSTKHNIK